jgi:hypothetical protein
LSRSSDFGESFQNSTISNSPYHVDVVYTLITNGDWVYAGWSAGSAGSDHRDVYVSVSRNRGDTFGPVQYIGSIEAMTGWIDTYRMAGLGERVYVAWRDVSTSHLLVAGSDNGGTSFDFQKDISAELSIEEEITNLSVSLSCEYLHIAGQLESTVKKIIHISSSNNGEIFRYAIIPKEPPAPYGDNVPLILSYCENNYYISYTRNYNEDTSDVMYYAWSKR